MKKPAIAVTVAIAAVVAGCSNVALQSDARSEYFEVRARGVAPEDMRHAMAVADRVWRLYEEALDVIPPRARLDLYASPEEYDAEVGIANAAYFPGSPGRIAVPATAEESVIHHEVAHHFIVMLLGDAPEWIHEGLAVYLEDIRWVEGRVVVSGLALRYLDQMVTGVTSTCHHRHVDYAQAWWRVSQRLEATEGSLHDRIVALTPLIHDGGKHTTTCRCRSRDRELTGVKDAPGNRSRSFPQRWVSEVKGLLVRSPDPHARASAARVLARWGELEFLHACMTREETPGVRAVMAAEIARSGDRGPLRAMASEIQCQHVLALVSRSVGRDFHSREALCTWLSTEY